MGATAEDTGVDVGVGDEPQDPITGQQDFDGGEVFYPEEIRVDGTSQLGMIDFGGKQPTSATLTLTGGAFDLIEGTAYSKGDVITCTVTAVVNEVAGVDKHDPKTGIVVSAKQRHKARIVDLTIEGA